MGTDRCHLCGNSPGGPSDSLFGSRDRIAGKTRSLIFQMPYLAPPMEAMPGDLKRHVLSLPPPIWHWSFKCRPQKPPKAKIWRGTAPASWRGKQWGNCRAFFLTHAATSWAFPKHQMQRHGRWEAPWFSFFFLNSAVGSQGSLSSLPTWETWEQCLPMNLHVANNGTTATSGFGTKRPLIKGILEPMSTRWPGLNPDFSKHLPLLSWINLFLFFT